jgi:ATP-dependent exoDNAse (exonuclease V) beta subunit
VPPPAGADAKETAEELDGLIRGFLKSDAFRRLKECEVLGREVPVLTSRDGVSMEGYADLVLREGSRTVVADYKTEPVESGSESERAAAYIPQGRVYAEAVSKALGGGPVDFWVVFLSSGTIVET